MNIDLHVKYLLVLSDWNETWNISTDFRQILRYQILWKSVQWEKSGSMRADRWTDTTKLIVVLCNSANALNIHACIMWPKFTVLLLPKEILKSTGNYKSLLNN